MNIYDSGERAFGWLSRIMSYMATIFLTIMMFVIVVDVICRYLFNSPLRGSIEIVEYLMIVVGSLGLASCTLQGKNISVSVLVDRMPSRIQRIFRITAYFLGLVIFFFLGWLTTLESVDRMLIYRDTTDVLDIPSYPFYFLLSFGFCCMFLAIFIRLIQYIKKEVTS